MRFIYSIAAFFLLLGTADAQTVYRYYFDGFNPPGISREFAVQEFKNACVRWERVCNVRIEETDKPTKQDYLVRTEALNSVGKFRTVPRLIRFTTVDPHTGERFDWDRSKDLFERMALHELGHMLFQGTAWKRWHSPNRYDVMYSGGGPLRITDETAQIAVRIHGKPKESKTVDDDAEVVTPPQNEPAKPVLYQCPEVVWDEIEGGVRYELWVNYVTPDGEQKGRVVYKRRMHDTRYSFAGFEPGHYRCWVRAELQDGTFSQWSDEYVIEVTGEID